MESYDFWRIVLPLFDSLENVAKGNKFEFWLSLSITLQTGLFLVNPFSSL